ncbi:hypothetical protein IJJ08_05045 [bacterium]|nr:hypothetical protein [bacterium]
MKSNTWQQKIITAGLMVAAASTMMTTPAHANVLLFDPLHNIRSITTNIAHVLIAGNFIGFLAIMMIGVIWAKWSRNEIITVNVHWFLHWCQIVLTTLAIVMVTISGGFLLLMRPESSILILPILLPMLALMIYDVVLPMRAQKKFRQQTALTKADKFQTWVMWLRVLVYWGILPMVSQYIFY